MKKHLILALIFPLIFTFVKCDDFKLKLHLNLRNTQGTIFSPMYFGVNNKATYGIDDSLGEFEIPNHPPNGIFSGLFQLMDSASGQPTNVLSYIDIQPSSDSIKFIRNYFLNIQRADDKALIIQWEALGNYIDSAKLYDVILGTLVNVNMKDSTIIDVKNEYLNKFYITVWYNKNAKVDVKEENLSDNSEFIVNSDNILINMKSNINFWKIYNNIGEIILSGDNSKNNINISNLNSGCYFLELNQGFKGKIVKKFIKFL